MGQGSTVARLRERIGDARAPQSPQHPDVAHWRAPTEADIDVVHAVMAAADAVDHPTWITPRDEIADTFDLPHIDHARDSVIAVDGDGAVIAVGSAFLHPARGGALTVHLGGCVHPAHRRRGIGSAVLRWQRERGRQQLAEALPTLDPALDWSADLKLYAEETNAGHRALAAAAGMTAERWFSTMVRAAAAPTPVVPVPDGIRISEFRLDQEEDARRARNDAFRDHWGSLPSQPEGWSKFIHGEHLRPDLSRVALDEDGAIVAFCLASVNEDDWELLGASHAYIDLIGVVRDHRRRGLAPAVIAATLDAVRTAGLAQVVLDVDTASPTGANTLYEGLGFAATERSVAFVERL